MGPTKGHLFEVDFPSAKFWVKIFFGWTDLRAKRTPSPSYQQSLVRACVRTCVRVCAPLQSLDLGCVGPEDYLSDTKRSCVMLPLCFVLAPCPKLLVLYRKCRSDALSRPSRAFDLLQHCGLCAKPAQCTIMYACHAMRFMAQFLLILCCGLRVCHTRRASRGSSA